MKCIVQRLKNEFEDVLLFLPSQFADEDDRKRRSFGEWNFPDDFLAHLDRREGMGGTYWFEVGHTI